MLMLTGLLRFVLKMADTLVFGRILPAFGLTPGSPKPRRYAARSNSRGEPRSNTLRPLGVSTGRPSFTSAN